MTYFPCVMESLENIIRKVNIEIKQDSKNLYRCIPVGVC